MMIKKIAFLKHGNAVDEYLFVKKGEPHIIYEGQSSLYVEQFLDAIRDKTLKYLIISTGNSSRTHESESGIVISFRTPGKRHLRYLLGQLILNFRIIQHLRAFDPNTVVYTMPRKMFWISWLYCVWTDRKILASFHGSIYASKSVTNVIDRLWMRFLLKGRAVQRVWAISEDMAEELQRLKSGKEITVIYPKYDETFMQNGDRPEIFTVPGFFVTFVGRAIEEKGVFDLVRIVGLLKNRIPNLRCIVLGDGTDLQEMKRIVKKEQLEDKFKFMGYRTNISDYLRYSDVLVLPTTKTFNEGLNKAAIEGLLWEVPIVASNVCGLHATVSQGIGYLVEPGDVSAFADNIYQIYQSAENSNSLKSRARILKPFYLSPPATLGSQLANYLKKNCTTKHG